MIEEDIVSEELNYNMGFGEMLALLKFGAKFVKKERTGLSLTKKPNNVLEFDENIAILSSQIGQNTLKKACSLKYFGDMGVNKDGKYFPHSGNYFFFKGKIEPQFSPLFLFQGIHGKDILGSPIYLAIESIAGLKL
jgi:hypothetical protein